MNVIGTFRAGEALGSWGLRREEGADSQLPAFTNLPGAEIAQLSAQAPLEGTNSVLKRQTPLHTVYSSTFQWSFPSLFHS